MARGEPMSSETIAPLPASEAAPRLQPRAGVKVGCEQLSPGLLPGVDADLLSLSANVLHMLCKELLMRGAEVCLSLRAPDGGAPVTCRGMVVWSVRAKPGANLVGIKLHTPLNAADLARLAVS